MLLLFVVGVVELSGNSEDSVLDSRCVLHVAVLLLPLHVEIPQAVRVEVQTARCNSVLEDTEKHISTLSQTCLSTVMIFLL